MPKFVDLGYGNPSYGMLGGDTPMAIWTGADDGSQMGVYHFTQETQSVSNVQLRAPENVPFGMEAGVFLVPSRPVIKLPCFAYGYGYGNFADPCGDEE